MASKFIRINTITTSILALTIITLQLTGCSLSLSNKMVDMINNGQLINIELTKPSYDVAVKGTVQGQMEWIQLDQLKSYNDGFRQGFDELFNVNIVTENGVNGKEGCLFVDEDGDRNGNTTLEDAFRNKVFVTKYWNDSKTKEKLAELSTKLYVDTDSTLAVGVAGALNAYYNLLPDGIDPTAFNPTQSLTREDFYSLVYKTEEGVQEIEIDTDFETAIGGKTDLSKFAQNVAEYGFLQIGNKSLDGGSYSGSISRAEAVYLMVNKHFSDQLESVTGKEKAFSDTKNAGDLALKAGFKEKNKETKEIVTKDRWQAYTLAYMIQNTSKGMQEELYKAMVVAKKLNLIHGNEARWDEPLSKEEAIQLIVNTHLAKNDLYGYLTDVEYGIKNPNKFTSGADEIDEETGKKLEVVGVDEDGFEYGNGWSELSFDPETSVPIDPDTKLSSGWTIGDLREELERSKELLEESGVTGKDLEEALDEIARDYGTTLADIRRVPDKPVGGSEKKDSSSGNTSGKTDSGGNKGNSGGNKGNSGGNKGKTDKGSSGKTDNSGSEPKEDTGGVSDAFKGHHAGEPGENTSDQDKGGLN